jgi:hypothetical protein
VGRLIRRVWLLIFAKKAVQQSEGADERMKRCKNAIGN